MKIEYFQHLKKNTYISNFIKICPVGFGLFYEEGWTETIITLHNNNNNTRQYIQRLTL